ncbi:MAG: excinuclease ABC subunit UvrA [Candidatus Kapabacteria bacterium]|nr:excinuclease ABC subunit UvrA [Candidatus Kapabacteria bacterium]
MAEQRRIHICGARTHNLKNISLSLPRNRLIVVTGLSGSGKSSLAVDTLYAEGQRRFVESLSAYARQFLERMPKPDVDSLSGLPPAIALEQRPLQRNPRSTVATMTELYDYFRLLYGRVGKTFCARCNRLVQRSSPHSFTEELRRLPEGTRLFVGFSIPESPALAQEQLEHLQAEGFVRLLHRPTAEVYQLPDVKSRTIAPDEWMVVVDRLVLRPDEETNARLVEAVELAFRKGQGRALAYAAPERAEYHASTRYECPYCRTEYVEPEPRLFSFNSPLGACPACQGFGRTIGIDPELVIPDKRRSLRDGAIHPFRTPAYAHHVRRLLAIAPKYGLPTEVPVEQLSPEQWRLIWEGADDYIGLHRFFAQLEEQLYKVQARVTLSRYRGYTRCHACGGSRLRTSARRVAVGGKFFPELITMSLAAAREWFQQIRLSPSEEAVVGTVLAEIRRRLGILVDIGLGYLTLDRLSHTLSGGEAQRIQLATALSSALVGTLYVLDEPSIGLHARDIERLLHILFRLRDLGNTLVVVEHDPDIIRHADWIVELGPGAGEQGGEVVFEGTAEELLRSHTLTGLYLSGQQGMEILHKRHPQAPKAWLRIRKPTAHNLKGEDVAIPLGCLTVITGVSGSGKSTLLYDVLYAHLRRLKGFPVESVGTCAGIEGAEAVDHVVLIDQAPPGRSSRSTPATYTKAFDPIRELFATTDYARQRGWGAGYFSFNIPGGRCEECQGEGIVWVEMQFLSDLPLECDACRGTRYKSETLHARYRGKSIVDVLQMTVDEAIEFFAEHRRVTERLLPLQRVGLGYLRLGQPTTMLSGGEAQRLKLAAYLLEELSGHTLFLLDEPTTGLHLHDVERLLAVLRSLVACGHSVLLIEHHLYVIAAADWVVDLGPEAGDAGGHVVAVGTPEQIAQSRKSHTGAALRRFYARGKTVAAFAHAAS